MKKKNKKNNAKQTVKAKQGIFPDTAPCKKNDRAVITIHDIGSGGEGIGFLPLKEAEQKSTRPDSYHTDYIEHADDKEHTGTTGSGKSEKPGGKSRKKGFAVFVKDAVPGDTIEATITKVTARYAYGHLDRILQPSPHRVEPRCPIAKTCGGCQLQAVDYPAQLEFKYKKVRENLIRIGGFAPEKIDAVIHPVVGMEEPWNYRNKEQVPVRQGKYGPVTGFYASHSHTVIPMTDCCIGHPQNRRILETILSWMQTHKIPAYDEATGKGLIRHILIRNGLYSGQTMVCVIANDTRLPFEKNLVEALCGLRETFSIPVSSIVLNTNTDRTNVITGRTLRTLWGSDDIEDTLHICQVSRQYGEENDNIAKTVSELNNAGERSEAASEKRYKGKAAEAASGESDTGESDRERSKEAASLENNVIKRNEKTVFKKTDESVTFAISPLSFYQVNPRQTEKLYSLALACAGLTGNETVWDLYCGVGTISLFMARHAKQVCGVEIIPEAIENAKKNADRNGITNARFYVGKAEEVLPDYVQKLKEKGEDPQIDVICVDPPRKGCDEKCIETMLEIAPRRIVYVSCDSATLARDLKKLAAGGYELDYVQPVDQFAHTFHIETCCAMHRRDA